MFADTFRAVAARTILLTSLACTQSLLEMFALGVQDVEEFQQVLSSELGGLEVRRLRDLMPYL